MDDPSHDVEPRARKVSTFTKAQFRNSVFDEACIIEGYLKKYSHGVFRRWQDRYFTVQGHYLKYYTDSNKIRKDLKGTIDLDGVKGANLTGKAKGEFRVVLAEGEAVMKAESDEEAMKWVEIIAAMVTEDVSAAAEEAAGGAEAVKDQMVTLTAEDMEESAALASLSGGRKPIWVNLEGAQGLAGLADKGGKCDAMVILTVINETAGGDAEQLWMSMSPVVAQDTEPTWGWKVLIPAVLQEHTLLFTVVDWEGDRIAFLGQACWRMADGAVWDASEKLVLPLGEFGESIAPKDGGGKPLKFKSTDADGVGELTVTIGPVRGAGACCAVKKRGETQHWKDRWVAVTEDRLMYYGDMTENRPKHEVTLRGAKAITHPGAVLELIDVETDEKVWHFRLETPEHGSALFRALRTAAGMQDLVAGRDRGVSISATGGFAANVKTVSSE